VHRCEKERTSDQMLSKRTSRKEKAKTESASSVNQLARKGEGVEPGRRKSKYLIGERERKKRRSKGMT